MARQVRTAQNVAEEPGSQSIAAVERAIDVLMLFGTTTAQSLGVTEIAEALSMPKAAVHRVLTSLRSRDLVAFDQASRRYSLGAGAVALGRAYLAKLDIRSVAMPELAWLSAETSETATLSVRHRDRRVYVDQVLPDREVRMEVAIGGSYPLHAGASSRTFLALLDEAEIAEYLAAQSLEPVTDKTITDPAKLRRELSLVRKRGYATSFGERQIGAGSVAAPIFDHEGRVAAVVSVCGPVERLRGEIDACVTALLAATARISMQMGHHKTP